MGPTSTSVEDDPEYPAQDWNITSQIFERQGIDGGIASVYMHCGEGCLQVDTEFTLSGAEITDGDKTRINSALSSVTGTKTPLFAYSTSYSTSQGETAPLTELMLDIRFQDLLLPAYENYALVLKLQDSSYEAIESTKLITINNTKLEYVTDLYGTWFLVGIGNKQS